MQSGTMNIIWQECSQNWRVFLPCLIPHLFESLQAPILSERCYIYVCVIQDTNGKYGEKNKLTMSCDVIIVSTWCRCIRLPWPTSWRHLKNCCPKTFTILCVCMCLFLFCLCVHLFTRLCIRVSYLYAFVHLDMSLMVWGDSLPSFFYIHVFVSVFVFSPG